MSRFKQITFVISVLLLWQGMAFEKPFIVKSDKMLSMEVALTPRQFANNKRIFHVGEVLKYTVKITNVSGAELVIPGKPEDRLVLSLTDPGDKSGYISGVGFRPTFTSFKLAPKESLEVTGELKILYPQVKRLAVVFANTSDSYHKMVSRSGPVQPDGTRTAVIVKEKVKIENPWLGTLATDKELNIVSLNFDEWMLSKAIITADKNRYAKALQKLRECESNGPEFKNYDPEKHGRIHLEHRNVTQQSEIYELIRSAGKDGHMHAVEWLWQAFESSSRNSPAHIQCMSELYGLFVNGVGVEHLDRFITVAESSADKESTATRLFALDAMSLILKRKDYIVCERYGNLFATEIDAAMKQKVQKAFETLLEDSEKDILLRTQRLLKL